MVTLRVYHLHLVHVCQVYCTLVVRLLNNTNWKAGGPGGQEDRVFKWKRWIFGGLAGCCTPEMITIRFAGWISVRIVSLQPDTDIQNLLWHGNRIRIRISETFLLIFRGFRLLEKVVHCTIIHLLSSFRRIFSAICAMTPSLSMVYSLYHSAISFPS